MLILITLLLGFSKGEPLSSKDNAYCEPRRTVIDTDADRHSYFPYFVEVFRCSGSCNSVSPDIKTCVPAMHHNVTISAYEFYTGEIIDVHARNDTACGCSCTYDASVCHNETQVWSENHCRCECRYDEPPSPCKPGLRWDSTECSCICDSQPRLCPKRQMWNPQKCGCYCLQSTVDRCIRKGRVLDQHSCKCLKEVVSGKGDAEEDSHKMYITAAVVEFVLLFFMFDFCLYHKHTGAMYTIKTFFCSKMKDSRFDDRNRRNENGRYDNEELVVKITTT